MRTFRGARLLASSLLAVTLLTALNLPLRAQSDNTDTGIDLPWVDPTNVPTYANFLSLSTFGLYSQNSFGPPLPWSPCPMCDTYFLGYNPDFGSYATNTYVVDDTAIASQSGMAAMTMSDDSPPLPPGGGDGSGDPGVPDDTPAYSYPSNYLYLIIDAVSNGTAFVRAMNTVADQTYELLSREQLSDTNWTSEGTFLGAENQDWTPTTVAVGTRTNSLFILARSLGRFRRRWFAGLVGNAIRPRPEQSRYRQHGCSRRLQKPGRRRLEQPLQIRARHESKPVLHTPSAP